VCARTHDVDKSCPRAREVYFVRPPAAARCHSPGTPSSPPRQVLGWFPYEEIPWFSCARSASAALQRLPSFCAQPSRTGVACVVVARGGQCSPRPVIKSHECRESRKARRRSEAGSARAAMKTACPQPVHSGGGALTQRRGGRWGGVEGHGGGGRLGGSAV